MASDAPHNYRRPHWLCLTCRRPWPCAAQRRKFLEKHPRGARHRLQGIMRVLAAEAAQDLGLTREQADARFLVWTFDRAGRGGHQWPTN
ncbi:flavin reductase [Dactylosporangium salmoneum]|uniref:Flavin reductase n=1 Tax=Dactylosporangium salmoneum TaxID=53361 RepID=A0ABN3FD95_9ACTN